MAEQKYAGPYEPRDPEDDVKVDLYNANHGKAPRTGGPYRDDLEREEAEKRRAKIEDREPDLDNPPTYAGDVLVPEHYLAERDTDKSHYSDAVKVENKPVASYVVPGVKSEPDPAQADWDHDQAKIDALRAAKELEELKSEPKTEPAKKTASSKSEPK